MEVDNVPPATATVGSGAAFRPPPPPPAPLVLPLLPVASPPAPPAACELVEDDGAPLVPSAEFDCDLGLVVYEASFGKFWPFLAPPLGVPDARFLTASNI